MASAGSPCPSLTRAVVICVLTGEAALAAILSSVHLGRHSLWLDEAVTAQLTRVPTRDFFTLITGREANSAAYFLLLRGWSRIGGDSASALRSVSVAAAALTVVGIYFVGVRLFGPVCALSAGLLYAMSPATVVAGQQARGFALETCILVFSVAALLRADAGGGPRWWVAWTALTALAGWIHFLALLVPVALVSALLIRDKRPSFPPLLGLAAATAAVIPLAYAGQRGGQGGLHFLQGATFANLRALPRFIGGGSWALTAFLVVAGAVSLVLSAVHLRRRWSSQQAFPILLTTLWVVVPVLLALAVSAVKPVFSERYFYYEVPPVALLVAGGLRFMARPAALLTLVLGCVLSAVAVGDVYSRASTQDWRTATERVLAESRPGDAIVFVPAYARVPFLYYLEGSMRKDRAPVPIVPAAPWGPLPLEDFPVAQAAADHPSSLVTGRRVWVVGFSAFAFASSAPDAEAVINLLERKRRMSQELEFPGVTVRLYDVGT